MIRGNSSEKARILVFDPDRLRRSRSSNRFRVGSDDGVVRIPKRLSTGFVPNVDVSKGRLLDFMSEDGTRIVSERRIVTIEDLRLALEEFGCGRAVVDFDLDEVIPESVGSDDEEDF